MSQTLSDSTPPDSQSAQELLKAGKLALQEGRYKDAIALLEAFCQKVQPGQFSYEQVQMWLVKAYHRNDQTEAAIALCQQLTQAQHEATRIWAERFLASLLPEPEPVEAQVSEMPVTETATSLPGIQLKTLEEFKQFCRSQFVDDLKEIERRRKHTLLSIGIVGIVLAGILIFLLNLMSLSIDFGVKTSQPSCRPGDPECVRSSIRREREAREREAYFAETGIEPPPQIESTPRDTSENPLPCSTYPEDSQARKDCTAQVLSKNRQSNNQWTIWFGVLRFLFLVLFAIVGCLWAFVAFYSSATETYARGFKTNIIQKIVEFIDSNNCLRYAPLGDSQATLIALQKSRLFPGLGKRSHLSQDDCFSGNVSNTAMFFSEVRAEVEFDGGLLKYLDLTRFMGKVTPGGDIITISIYSLGFLIKIIIGFPYIARRILKGQRIDYRHFEAEVLSNVTSRRSVFKGLFFFADFNKRFRSKTFILPNSLRSSAQILNQQRGQVVRLEDPEFAKLFMVYSNDQVESRYILSTNLMEKLVQFRKKANRGIQIAFVDSMIFIAIAYDEDLFEPRLFSTMWNFNPLREYFETLQLMISIVEELHLDRRIWTKV